MVSSLGLEGVKSSPKICAVWTVAQDKKKTKLNSGVHGGREVLIKICILSNIKSKCWNSWDSRSGAKTRISSVGSSKKPERALGCYIILLASVSTLVEGQPRLCLLASHAFQVKVVGAIVQC